MIEIKNVSKWYGEFQVLTDCTATINKGEVVVVCGPSGSGKSTLIKTVNALEPFQKGDIVVDGTSLTDPKTDLNKLRSRIGMVFQNFELFPHMTIEKNLAIAQMKVLKRSKDEAYAKGKKLLERVGLGAHAHKFPGQMSGGQQQRVAIARALAMDPKVLLMDEPFGALDALTRAHLQDELMKITAATKKTVIMVTHDVDEAVLLSDRIVMMTNGPAATVGEILHVDLPHPRNRLALADNAQYNHYRAEVLRFLYEKHAHKDASSAPAAKPAASDDEESEPATSTANVVNLKQPAKAA